MEITVKLNHIDLPVTDTASVRVFFERHFDMRCIFSRDDGLTVLLDEDGAALTLSPLPSMTLVMKIMMAGFISDAAHRMATEAKRAQNAAGEHQLQKPTYISRLLRRRRGSLPPYAAEAGGALVYLKTFRAAVAARYGAQKQAAELPNRRPAREVRLGESRRIKTASRRQTRHCVHTRGWRRQGRPRKGRCS